MNLLKKLGNISLVILCIFSVFVSIFYLIYHFNFKSDTIGTIYIGEQSPVDLITKSEELTDTQIAEYENRVLFNVNYYSNKNNNGLALNEVRLEYFTDYSMTTDTCRSTGIQLTYDLYDYLNTFLYDRDTYKSKYANNDNIKHYYYETYDGISWTGGFGFSELNKPLTRDFAFICKIDNTPYLFQLDGTYEQEVDKTFLGIPIGTKIVTKNYDYVDLIFELLSVAKTNSNGVGEYYISFDLSKYFTNVKAYNEETKQFDKLPSVDIAKKYCMIKINYSDDGVTNVKQSMFKTIACDSSYGITNVEYWQERFVFNLNETNLNLRYSDEFKGYFVSLSIADKNMFNDMPRAIVNISINLSNSLLVNNDINIVGIDYNGFQNLQIDTLKILGVGDFYLQDECLKDTNLDTLEYSNSINLKFGSNVINTEYKAVEL